MIGDTNKVKACPICGKRYAVHCYHEGREVPTVPMDTEAARKLRVAAYHALIAEAEELLEPGDILGY